MIKQNRKSIADYKESADRAWSFQAEFQAMKDRIGEKDLSYLSELKRLQALVDTLIQDIAARNTALSNEVAAHADRLKEQYDMFSLNMRDQESRFTNDISMQIHDLNERIRMKDR